MPEVPDHLLARCTFPAAGTSVVCGCSGGPDSTALVVLAVAAGLDVEVVHVDHGLRRGSAEEAEVVAATAGRLGVAARSVHAPVDPGGDLEARARRVRHDALGPGALLGHTADDRAEWVLLALLRGAGLDGVSALAPEGPSMRHPILALRRAETEALCADLGLTVVRDPTNLDPRHRRNRVRAEVLPLLADVAERDPVPLLARFADLAAADAAVVDDLAAQVDPTDARTLATAPVAVARRAVRAWLRPHVGGVPPDLGAVERVLDVARGAAIGCDVARGVTVRRSDQVLSVRHR